MENRNLTLEVLICTFGPEGGRRVQRMQLPEIDNVSYLVSWQGDCPKVVPAPLAERRDLRFVFLDGKGLSRNRNHCLDNARGDILLVADDDLRFYPDGLKGIMDVFAANPSLEYGSFMYDGADGKTYPAASLSLKSLPKDFYQTSFEVALRRESRAGALRFDEEFGLGAPQFGAGEEELVLKRARIKGLDCRFFPLLIASHAGVTTGLAAHYPDSVLRSRGVLTAVEFPFTAPLRVVLNSWRIVRKGQAGFFRALRCQTAGLLYGWFSQELKDYLNASL